LLCRVRLPTSASDEIMIACIISPPCSASTMMACETGAWDAGGRAPPFPSVPLPPRRGQRALPLAFEPRAVIWFRRRPLELAVVPGWLFLLRGRCNQTSPGRRPQPTDSPRSCFLPSAARHAPPAPCHGGQGHTVMAAMHGQRAVPHRTPGGQRQDPGPEVQPVDPPRHDYRHRSSSSSDRRL